MGTKWRLFWFFFLLSSSIFATSSVMSITSDQLEISFKENITELTFSGNVCISAPLFSATCLRAHVLTIGKAQELASDLGNIQHVTITGPLTFQQEERTCNADNAEIVPAQSTIILQGNATIKDPLGTVSAGEIRVNYATKDIQISSLPSNPVQVDISSLSPRDESSIPPNNSTSPSNAISIETRAPFYNSNNTNSAEKDLSSKTPAVTT